ncbi:Gfo/Idh/MocA family protein [Bradyrhizobium sp. 6(2017)]|uniref:Gfo/Idh/MocA family protein n=1 Tax=Bradyrhizobium sp. 6(2017) TaxID=1197460 RepID=UPI0013E1740E|nr:Gfo/Idh/MocA family oxidoreductase [Bradyrhizobium sp. 6(2017)]QIG95518.1 Gfo/Idh/MocA family oxidoreductase [Bradyrhizobium sp. 6(2017)]
MISGKTTIRQNELINRNRIRPTRVALIGPGKHAEEYLLPALRLVKDVRLICISSRSEQKAKDSAARWGADDWTIDWRSVINPQTCDAAIVAATPQAHAEVVAQALRCGVAIFAEKPPAPDTVSLRSLISAEGASRSPSFVGFNFVFAPTIKRFGDQCSKYGGPRLLKLRCVSNKPTTAIWGYTSLPQSILLAVGIHALSIALSYIPTLQYESARVVYINENLMAILITLKTSDGRIAEIELGNYANRFILELEAITDQGTVIGLENLTEFEVYGSALSRPNGSIYDAKEVVRFSSGALLGSLDRAGYVSELSSFTRSVRSGEPSEMPISRALPAYVIIDNILLDTM